MSLKQWSTPRDLTRQPSQTLLSPFPASVPGWNSQHMSRSPGASSRSSVLMPRAHMKARRSLSRMRYCPPAVRWARRRPALIQLTMVSEVTKQHRAACPVVSARSLRFVVIPASPMFSTFSSSSTLLADFPFCPFSSDSTFTLFSECKPYATFFRSVEICKTH